MNLFGNKNDNAMAAAVEAANKGEAEISIHAPAWGATKATMM